jgi:hypothetical protein
MLFLMLAIGVGELTNTTTSPNQLQEEPENEEHLANEDRINEDRINEDRINESLTEDDEIKPSEALVPQTSKIRL